MKENIWKKFVFLNRRGFNKKIIGDGLIEGLIGK